MSNPQVAEEQARLLEEALTVVRQQTHLMRKCLETQGKLMDALKCGSASQEKPLSHSFPRSLLIVPLEKLTS
jgi:hypothetical protein